MKLSDLGPAILVVHLIELLPHNTVLALTQVEKALYDQLGHLRFRRATLCRSDLPGSLIAYLRPSTLQTILELNLNGPSRYTSYVMRSENFNGVRAVTLFNQLQGSQKQSFGQFARRQLTSLSEIADRGTDIVGTSTSTLCDLEAGCLSELEVLYLQNVVLPPLQRLITNTDGIALHLKAITFLPFRSYDAITSVSRCTETYIKDTMVLLSMLSDRMLLPAVKTVEILLGRTDSNSTMTKERGELLKKIFDSAATHGGWRLTIKKPTILLPMLVKAYIEGWSCWCSSRKGDLFFTVKEVEEFVEWCVENGRYPRWEEFVDGNIHLDVDSNGGGVMELKKGVAARLARVHGVSILPGFENKFPDALGVVSHATRCLSIQLKAFWERLEFQVLDTTKFTIIEYLRIQIADVNNREPRYRRPRNLSVNLSFSLVTMLDLPKWSNLKALSIPALALQWSPPASEPPQPTAASCGKHVPAYSLHWVAKCHRLQRFQVTNWTACVRCYEEQKRKARDQDDAPNRSLAGGLKTCMPAGVTDVLISGVFTTTAPKLWGPILKIDFQNALGRKVDLDFDQLHIE